MIIGYCSILLAIAMFLVELCKAESTRTPCDYTCNDEPEWYDGLEVCGLDGVTYRSYHCMYQAACRSGMKEPHEAYLGRCSKDCNVAMKKPECQDKKVCGIDKSGQAKCCNLLPPMRSGWPLCGSDGRTYMNHYLLQNAQCYNESIKLAHDGCCDSDPKPWCFRDGRKKDKRKRFEVE